MSEWRTIDSAPKDGTCILTFQEPENGGICGLSVSSWDENINGGGESGFFDGSVASWGYEEYAILRPTHWMPLPSPPKEEVLRDESLKP